MKMKSNLKTKLIFFSAFAALLAPVVEAQVVSGVVPAIVARPPGFYEDIRMNDVAFLNIYNQLDKDDADYVRSIVSQMNSTLALVYQNQLAQVLKLQNSGLQSPSGVNLQEYLKLTADLSVALQAAESLIETTLQVPSLRRTQNKVELTTGKVSIIAQGRLTTVDFNPLLTILKTKMKSVHEQIYAIEIYVNSPQKGGRVLQRVGSALDKSLLVAFTPAQINLLREEADQSERNARNSFRMGPLKQVSEDNRAVVMSFVKTYGLDDRYRLQMDDVGFQKSLALVEDIFITRSLMRYRYGVALGAFGTPDTRRKFHLNIAPRRGDNELVLDQQTYFSLEELIAKRRAIVEIFKTQDLRSKNPLALDLSVGLVARLSSSINFFRGSLTYSFCNAFVLNLMLNDIDEEIMMTEAGGLALVKSNIQKRVLAKAQNEQEIERYKAILRVGDMATGQLDKSIATDGGGSVFVAKTISTAATRYQTSMQQVNAKRQQAASLEKDLNEYAKLNQDRVDDLFSKGK